MTKLAITLATRGRPQQLIETIRRSIANWTDPNTKLYIIADEDDLPTREAMLGLQVPVPAGQRTEPPIYLSVITRPDTIAEKWNRVLELAPDADVYMIAADDCPDVTPGYDTKILEAASRFSDGVGVVYGHLANASFPGVMAPTRKFAEELGFLFPPYFPYWFVDHWIDDVARMTGRIAFADVMTDQSRAGQTQEMREPAWWATWYDAAYRLRRRQAYEIIYQCYKGAEAQILTDNFPLTEYRSRWINNNVRQSAMTMTGPPWDERYARLRQKAVDMIPHLLDGMPAEPDTDTRGAKPGDPGFLGSWGAQMYLYRLTPPTVIPDIARAFG